MTEILLEEVWEMRPKEMLVELLDAEGNVVRYDGEPTFDEEGEPVLDEGGAQVLTEGKPVMVKKTVMVNTYLGKVTVEVKDLTPEFLELLKNDPEDKQGWHKYRKVMRDAGYDIE